MLAPSVTISGRLHRPLRHKDYRKTPKGSTPINRRYECNEYLRIDEHVGTQHSPLWRISDRTGITPKWERPFTVVLCCSCCLAYYQSCFKTTGTTKYNIFRLTTHRTGVRALPLWRISCSDKLRKRQSRAVIRHQRVSGFAIRN